MSAPSSRSVPDGGTRCELAGRAALGLAALLLAALAAAIPLLASAPARAAGPYPDLGSCPVFPAPPASLSPHAPSLATEAAWNQDIAKAPRAANSAQVIAYIDAHGGTAIHPDFGSPRAYGFPYVVVGAGAEELPIHYTAYGAESSPGPFPIPAGAPVEGGAHAEGDRHVLVVDRATCKLFELYDAHHAATPKPHWDAGSGVEWDLRSAALRPDGWTSADAAGLPIFPGLVRYEEAAAGHVDHAIRVTMESTRNAWIHPASHCAGDTVSGAAPPMGLRLRLKAGYPLGGMGPAARTIAVAMKEYGLIVAGNGSNWYISGTSDRRWDDGELDALKAIPGRDFEVVRSAARVHAC
ncbi:MAG TPA: hypothetical protein VHA76_07065 [Solirubrobacterales bacterium]|nr:hypothetical protein [Solirubrobacterales bacterium]